MGSTEELRRRRALFSCSLSASELTDSRLPGFGAPGPRRFSDQSSRRTHTQRLGCTRVTAAVNRAVGRTLTVQQHAVSVMLSVRTVSTKPPGWAILPYIPAVWSLALLTHC